MRPFLHDGDFLPVQPTNSEGLRPGDVVLYGEGNVQALHRLYRRRGNGWSVADDAGRLPFHFVPDSQIRGRLVGGAPQGRIGLILGFSVRLLFRLSRPIKNRLLPRPA